MVRGCKDFFCENYFQKLDLKDRLAFKSGQLYEMLITYPLKQSAPLVLDLDNYDPSNERNTTFKIVDYQRGMEDNYPIKELGLRNNELLQVVKCKRRPGIVIGYIESDWLATENPQKLLLVAPIFSFKPDHNEEFILRNQAFKVPSAFYLPPEDNIVKESAVRFELMQAVQKGLMQPWKSDGQPVAMSDEAHATLLNHFSNYIAGEPLNKRLNEDMVTYGELIMEELEKAKLSL